MNNNKIESTVNSFKKSFTELKDRFDRFQKPEVQWPALKIGTLTAPVPVVQGGMGVGVSLSGLAAAVAEAGGIGVIAANVIGMLEKDYFKDGKAANLRALSSEIRKAREMTKGIIGVNIMVAVNDFHALLDQAIEDRADIVFMGAGLPVKNIPVEAMRAAGVHAAPIVSSARAAGMIFRMWKSIYNDIPDAVVFEGPKAGGHLGFTEEQINDPDYQLEKIVPEIVEILKPYEEEFGKKVPVIAGGGVFSGEDVYRTLSCGASAVQMGTRFVATEECDADRAFKEAYVNCTEEQIGLIKSPVGMPGRAIRNQFIKDSEEGKRPEFKCAWQCLASCKAGDAKYCISIALNNARRGSIRQGFVFAGTNAYRVEEIVTVAQLVGELKSQYERAYHEQLNLKMDRVTSKVGELMGQYVPTFEKWKKLSAACEGALLGKIRDFQNSPSEELQKQKIQMSEKLLDLQNQISNKLAAGFSLCKIN